MVKTDRGSSPHPAKRLLCPKCGTEISLERYAQLIEVQIDEVRDICPTCGAVIQLDLTPFHHREQD